MPFNQHSDTLLLRGVRIQTKKYELELLYIYFGRKMNRCLLSRDSVETLVVSCSLLRSQDFLTFVVWLIKLVLKALYDVSHLNVQQSYRESAATTTASSHHWDCSVSKSTSISKMSFWNQEMHLTCFLKEVRKLHHIQWIRPPSWFTHLQLTWPVFTLKKLIKGVLWTFLAG